MKKILLSFLTLFTLFAVYSKQTSAHVGGGPPFLVVDGVYGITNPYYFSDPTINIPQDSTGKTYLVNKPIHFFVDTDKLLVPPDIANASTYRWTMSEDSKIYQFGKSIVYTYTKPGSYIMSLEVKAPQDPDWTLIDTMQLDVLPDKNYKLPRAAMRIQTTQRQSTKPLLFQSTYTTDPSAKVANIIWGFGDGTNATKQNVLHTYTNLQDYSTFPVIFRVTDSHGFRGYAGVIIEATKGKLQFVDTNGKENPIPISDTITELEKKTPQKISYAPWILLGCAGAFIILIAVIIFLARKTK